jgi:hypothetical protein
MNYKVRRDVEYYVPAVFATKHPTLFGRNFDGPLLNHE